MCQKVIVKVLNWNPYKTNLTAVYAFLNIQIYNK